ncbi:MAG: hypothetical protein WDO70_00895 [Alphaproteobacteria bacterium]
MVWEFKPALTPSKNEATVREATIFDFFSQVKLVVARRDRKHPELAHAMEYIQQQAKIAGLPLSNQGTPLDEAGKPLVTLATPWFTEPNGDHPVRLVQVAVKSERFQAGRDFYDALTDTVAIAHSAYKLSVEAGGGPKLITNKGYGIAYPGTPIEIACLGKKFSHRAKNCSPTAIRAGTPSATGSYRPSKRNAGGPLSYRNKA